MLRGYKKLKTFILIPAFNEASVISKTISDLKKYFNNILVVNDASNDNTLEILNKLEVISITHPINLGQGGAIKTGIEYLLKYSDADIVITFDADGQHSVIDAVKMQDMMKNKNLDIILASRFIDKKHLLEIPLLKKWLLINAVKLLSFLSGVDVTDTHNGLKAYRADALRKITFQSDSYSFENEILFEIKKNNLNFQELSSKVIYTEYSKSKGQSILNSTLILEDLVYMLLRR